MVQRANPRQLPGSNAVVVHTTSVGCNPMFNLTHGGDRYCWHPAKATGCRSSGPIAWSTRLGLRLRLRPGWEPCHWLVWARSYSNCPRGWAPGMLYYVRCSGSVSGMSGMSGIGFWKHATMVSEGGWAPVGSGMPPAFRPSRHGYVYPVPSP